MEATPNGRILLLLSENHAALGPSLQVECDARLPLCHNIGFQYGEQGGDIVLLQRYAFSYYK